MSSDDFKEIDIEATVENLSRVNDFVAGFLARLNCSPRMEMQLELAVEEIFVNIANYAYGGKKGRAVVRGRLLAEPAGLELVFADSGQPYNPLARKDPDVNLAVEERSIGGLGIYLVKKNVDEVHYDYRNGQNILTLRKYVS